MAKSSHGYLIPALWMIPTYAAKATHLNQSRQQSAIDSSTLSFSPLSDNFCTLLLISTIVSMDDTSFGSVTIDQEPLISLTLVLEQIWVITIGILVSHLFIRWKRASYCSRNPVLEFEGHVLVAIFSGVLIGPGCLKFSSSVRRNRILFGGLTKRMTENLGTDVIQALEGVEGKHTLFKGTKHILGEAASASNVKELKNLEGILEKRISGIRSKKDIFWQEPLEEFVIVLTECSLSREKIMQIFI